MLADKQVSTPPPTTAATPTTHGATADGDTGLGLSLASMRCAHLAHIVSSLAPGTPYGQPIPAYNVVPASYDLEQRKKLAEAAANKYVRYHHLQRLLPSDVCARVCVCAGLLQWQPNRGGRTRANLRGQSHLTKSSPAASTSSNGRNLLPPPLPTSKHILHSPYASSLTKYCPRMCVSSPAGMASAQPQWSVSAAGQPQWPQPQVSQSPWPKPGANMTQWSQSADTEPGSMQVVYASLWLC